MFTYADRVLDVVSRSPGLTDRQLTDVVKGKRDPQQHTNQTCRLLELQGKIVRRRRSDSLIGNYPVLEGLGAKAGQPKGEILASAAIGPNFDHQDPLSEDGIKRHLEAWLASRGWQTEISWGKNRGSTSWPHAVKSDGS